MFKKKKGSHYVSLKFIGNMPLVTDLEYKVFSCYNSPLSVIHSTVPRERDEDCSRPTGLCLRRGDHGKELISPG